MTAAQKVKQQAKRAGGTIKQIVALAKQRGADIDVEAETEKIRVHLNDPKKARAVGSISRHVLDLATFMATLPRPQELLRAT